MLDPIASRARRLALAAVLVALAACGGGATTPGGGPVPIDPNRPGDPAFADALSHYDLAAAAAAAARAAQAAGDAALAAQKFAEAVSEYALARDGFDALRGDPTLCPDVSIRCDNSAYLAGRCSYEIGSIRNVAADFQDAMARLDGMLADFPSSALADSAAYFDGRAHFQLTSGFGLGTYADAEILFERSLALAPGGVFADNALYYDGRCEFELGLALVTPLSPAPGTPEYLQARSWFDQAVAPLQALPSRFPGSSYRDNAAYYLGRSLFEKPFDAATPAGDAERVQSLGTAITSFGQVTAALSSSFRPGAFYWRGRAEYARAFYPGFPGDLAAALADFDAVPATSTYHDNALAYAVRTEVRQGNCAGACADYAALLAAYPASSYTASAGAYLAASVCAATCP